MEPDEIKKMWQEVNLLKEKQQFSDLKIKEMLKNKGKTALSKLLNTANFYRFAMIPLGILFCFLSHNFFEKGGYYTIYPLIFLLFCICLEPFEIYLYRLLKEIDFAVMPVKEVSKRILKYQNFIRKWKMYGITFGIVYLGFWYYLFYKIIIGNEIVWGLIIFMFLMCIAVGFFTPFLLKKLYFNHINQIQESLNELKEFEEC